MITRHSGLIQAAAPPEPTRRPLGQVGDLNLNEFGHIAIGHLAVEVEK